MNDPRLTIPLPSDQRLTSTRGLLKQHRPEIARALKNNHALLPLTLLWSAGVAASGVALELPTLGLAIALVGFLGLLFAIHSSEKQLPSQLGMGGGNE